MPHVELLDSDGRRRTLSDVAGGARLLLYVYRGCWCPYCLFRLGELRDLSTKFERLGIRLAALSVDEVDDAAVTRRRGRLPFTLLCDPSRTVIASWGLLNSKSLLPAHPATFLWGPSQRLELVSVDDGYASVSAHTLLDACRRIVSEQRVTEALSRARSAPPLKSWIAAWRNELRVRWRLLGR